MAATTTRSEPPAVVRTRDCPTLLRVFVRRGGHSSVAHYHGLEGTPVTAGDDVIELALYVWSDSSLIEIAEIVRERVEGARTRRRGGEKPCLSLSLVYPDRDGRYMMRPLGRVRGAAKDRPHDTVAEERVTLADAAYDAGDYLDVAVLEL